MIVVADSGSSKADWRLNLPGPDNIEFRTIGINPFFLNEVQIEAALRQVDSIKPYLKEIKEVHFFGAGCSSPDTREIISNALSKVFTNAFINVESDLVAAAYATCEDKEGLSCILGTGSNISYYDGKQVKDGKHGIGYILGDEGSGTFFGKKLIADYLYENLPAPLHKSFANTYNISKETVLHNVYQKPFPNTYLASFVPFMGQHKDDPYVVNLLYKGFEEFVKTNIFSFPNQQKYTCHFIGSIAYHFQEVLREVCKDYQVNIGKILKHPIDELFNYIISRELN